MGEKIKMIELFSGIGAQAMAMREVGLDFESLCCEIDPKAYKSYCAIHGDTENLGDITKVEHLPPCNLLFYSFPCTDISMAGKGEGFTEGSGTRSSLLWEVKRLLLDMKERADCGLPLTLIMENVKALVFKKNLPEFNRWIEFLDGLGYTSVWKVLNAKDYGVPQNRERVFLVSRLDGKRFIFPEPCPDGRVLRDVLEENVPESFYLSDEKIAHYEQHRIRQEENNRGFGWEPKGSDVIARSITGNADRHCSNWLVEGAGQIKAGNLHLDSAFGQANDVHSVEGVSPTLTTCHVGIGQPKIEVADKQSISIQGKSMDEPQEMMEGDALAYKFINVAKSPVLKQTSPSIVCEKGGGVMTAVSDKKIEIAGDLNRPEYQDRMNRVYGTDGLAPTMASVNGGGMQPKIQVVGDLNIPGESDTNNRVHSADGLSPTVRASHTPKMMDSRTGMVLDGYLDKPFVSDRYVYHPEGMGPTLLGERSNCNARIRVDSSEELPNLQEGDAASMLTSGREKRQNGPRYKKDGTSFTITCQDKYGVIQNDSGKIRIRYLTPRECWRLQGFPDWAYDKAVEAGMSKTALYSQAGNSIAVPVLKAIFHNLYIEPTFEQEKKEWF